MTLDADLAAFERSYTVYFAELRLRFPGVNHVNPLLQLDAGALAQSGRIVCKVSMQASGCLVC